MHELDIDSMMQVFLFISLSLIIPVNSSGGVNSMERVMILSDSHSSVGLHLS